MTMSMPATDVEIFADRGLSDVGTGVVIRGYLAGVRRFLGGGLYIFVETVRTSRRGAPNNKRAPKFPVRSPEGIANTACSRDLSLF
jgi:hypothetical protein